ncbi:MAG: hypothetical protein AAB408_00905 [Patescibacteria group bacterium]
MQDDMMKDGQSCSSHGGGCCKCMHHKVPVVMVLLIGLLFLAKGLGWVADSTVDVAWPALVILAAASKLGGSKCKCC